MKEEWALSELMKRFKGFMKLRTQIIVFISVLIVTLMSGMSIFLKITIGNCPFIFVYWTIVFAIILIFLVIFFLILDRLDKRKNSIVIVDFYKCKNCGYISTKKIRKCPKCYKLKTFYRKDSETFLRWLAKDEGYKFHKPTTKEEVEYGLINIEKNF